MDFVWCSRLENSLFSRLQKLHNCDEFSFLSVKFAFMSINIPACPSYDFYASQLSRCARCNLNYYDFLSHDPGDNACPNRFYGQHINSVGLHKGDVCEMCADSINNTNLSYYFCSIVHFDQLRCDEWHQLLWIYCNYIDKMNLRSLDDRSSA